eukprot:Clim_evm32s66 gene=Clim_evmTU32s66
MSANGSPIDTWSMATQDEKCDFKAIELKRRPLGDYDVLIDMKYCGVCHTDLHIAANHFPDVRPAKYPCVPGHELAGICAAVGPKVTKFKVGDTVGVGCMVDSCQECSACKRGEEQFCSKVVGTYNAPDKNGRAASYPPGKPTYGGYTTAHVCNEEFVIRIPKDYPLECAGPVMCSGVTMYSPLRRYGAKEGDTVGIVGLGGLGRMGIAIAKAMGCRVVCVSRSQSKEAMAKEAGADEFVASGDPKSMEAAAGLCDLILNTVPSYHNYTHYNSLLKSSGRQVLLGMHAGFVGSLIVDKVTFGTSRVAASAIGGIPATQEIIDLCAKHKIYPKVDIRPCWDLNEIYTALDKGNDSAVRYVLDIENTLNEKTLEKCTAPPPEIAEPHGTISPWNIVKEFFWLFFTFQWL